MSCKVKSVYSIFFVTHIGIEYITDTDVVAYLITLAVNALYGLIKSFSNKYNIQILSSKITIIKSPIEKD